MDVINTHLFRISNSVCVKKIEIGRNIYKINQLKSLRFFHYKYCKKVVKNSVYFHGFDFQQMIKIMIIV